MLRAERQSAQMSTITNDGLTRAGLKQQLYPYGNSGRQRAEECQRQYHESSKDDAMWNSTAMTVVVNVIS